MIFVFDLDGTLLNSQKTISEKDKKAVKELYARGHRIVIATARPPRSIDKQINTLEIEHDTIYYNGALIRFADGKTCRHVIEYSVLNDIEDYLDLYDSDAVLSFEENDRWYTFRKWDFENAFGVNCGPKIIAKDQFLQKSPDKILISNYKNYEELKGVFGCRVNIIETDAGSLIQIMSKDASKESGILDIVKKYNSSRNNVYCFGDDYNDIGMFAYCGKSVAMGNAIQELKDRATFITKSNDESGISEFIEKEIFKRIQ